MMPLTMTKAGETVTIRRISGKDEVRLHLAELEFVVGSEVTVVNGSRATRSCRSSRAVWHWISQSGGKCRASWCPEQRLPGAA